MKKKYEISLIGCDDATSFDIELNETELELVKKICEESERYSTYLCMPVMEVKEVK